MDSAHRVVIDARTSYMDAAEEEVASVAERLVRFEDVGIVDCNVVCYSRVATVEASNSVVVSARLSNTHSADSKYLVRAYRSVNCCVVIRVDDEDELVNRIATSYCQEGVVVKTWFGNNSTTEVI